MGALKNLWNSERGLVAIALIVACTVLVAIGRITVEQWQSYSTWIFGIYVAGKTATGTAQIIRSTPPGGSPSDLLGTILGPLFKQFPPPAPSSTDTPPAPAPPTATPKEPS